MSNQLILFPSSKSQNSATNPDHSFFNTSHAKGEQLNEYQGKAANQDNRILKLFKIMASGASPVYLLSASQVFALYHRVRTSEADTPPITSIRRAMTNLTNSGDLEKTDIQIEGLYKRPEYQYRLINI